MRFLKFITIVMFLKISLHFLLILMQSRRNYKSLLERFPFTLICGWKPNSMSLNEFKMYIKQVLHEENVAQSKYYIKVLKYYALVDFANEEDMNRVMMNRKYDVVDGFLCHFNKHYIADESKTLYINGIPKGTSAKELDDILSESYIIHEVTKLVPSDEDPNYLFATVKFDFEEEAKQCSQTLFEIKGHHVKVYNMETIESSKSSSGTDPSLVEEEIAN